MSDLKFESLYYFLVLAESCHYGEASEQLYLTQQALSKSVKQLEEKLGVKLFRRQGRSQQLTAAGQQLQQKARILLNQVQKIETHFDTRLISAPHQILRCAAPMFPRLPGMPVIKKFLRANPHLRFECQRDLAPVEMEQALLSGRLDCALYLQPPTSPQLHSRVIASRRFVAVAHPEQSHRPWDEWSYIVVRPVFQYYDAHFWPPEMHGCQVAAEVDLETGLYLCTIGKGAMYMPENYVQYRLVTKRLITLAPPPFEHALRTWLIWKPDLPPGTLASLFVEQMLERAEL